MKIRVDKIEFVNGQYKFFKIISEKLTKNLQKSTTYEEIPEKQIPAKTKKRMIANFKFFV